jgi:hypothetical protein
MPVTALVRAAVLTAVAAAALSLSGCAALLLLVPGSTGGSSSSAQPAVGDCWHSTFTQAQTLASWTGEGRVACTGAHQLYTYGVAQVTSSASTWRTSGGDLDSGIATAANTACEAKYGAFIPSSGAQGGRLQRYFFVAPVPAWAAGARWVRCDVGVLEVGSPYQDPRFEALPPRIATLVGQVTAHPDAFTDCVTTTDASGNTGPLDDPNALIADCTQDYQWMFEFALTVPGDDGVPYPSDAEIGNFTQTNCGDPADAAGRGWIAYVPTAEQWDAGRRDASCWFDAGRNGADGGTTA